MKVCKNCQSWTLSHESTIKDKEVKFGHCYLESGGKNWENRFAESYEDVYFREDFCCKYWRKL